MVCSRTPVQVDYSTSVLKSIERNLKIEGDEIVIGDAKRGNANMTPPEFNLRGCVLNTTDLLRYG